MTKLQATSKVIAIVCLTGGGPSARAAVALSIDITRLNEWQNGGKLPLLECD